MENKYGKRIFDKGVQSEFMRAKVDFFQKNTELLKKNDQIAQIYKAQPKRKFCKICKSSIEQDVFFESHTIPYFKCKNCSHLNGGFEDTKEFADQVYCSESYGVVYQESDLERYLKRMETIYKPKAEILFNYLKREAILNNITLLDIGAGSGYFVLAAKNSGIHNVKGIEPSKNQVKFANSMLKSDLVEVVDMDKMADYIFSTKSEVLSAIGVLEHITNLDEISNAITNNKNINYLFISVPLLSLSNLLEIAFQDSFNRHLGGGHTHLFSLKSLKYFSQKIGFDIALTWQFGSDIMDLYRFIMNALCKQSDSVKEYFNHNFISLIDDIQFLVDKHNFSSEIHVILKRI